MSTEPIFVPTGTVRRKFSESVDRADFDEVLAGITLLASHEQFDPALVWTARRLVDNEYGLEDLERQQAVMVVLALLIAVGEGSTRLPLDEPDYLDTILERLQARCVELLDDLQPCEHTELLKRTASTLATIRESNPAGVLSTSTLPELFGIVSGDEVPYRPLLLSQQGSSLTSERLLRKERAQAAAFRDLQKRTVDCTDGPALGEAIDDLTSHPTRYRAQDEWHDQHLNYEQARAVLAAAVEPLSLITGGPGTGKTTIVVSILRLLTRLGVAPAEVALAAPTGKAAYRMKESIDAQLRSLRTRDTDLSEADRRLRHDLTEARTLHRLLGYSPSRERFWRNAENPVEARVVICDEASMIDVALMHALIEALPDDARLVLVGDADQLPAVSSGAVFRDLVADPAPLAGDLDEMVDRLASDEPRLETVADSNGLGQQTTRLVYSYRMEGDDGGGDILKLARSIRDCDSPSDEALIADLGDALELEERAPFEGVARLTATTDRDDFASCWFEKFAAPPTLDDVVFRRQNGQFDDSSHDALQRLFEHFGKARILCVTQVFRTGARAINRQMHRLYLADLPERDRTRFSPLEPVMVHQNDYDLGVFNGDQGVIARVVDDGHGSPQRYVVFPRSQGGFRAIPLSQLRDQITLAYATSIHKSQGSEFHHVAVVLPETRIPLLTKQLLYTAVTRASQSVTVVDPAGLFEVGAASPVRRFTGLAQLLDGD